MNFLAHLYLSENNPQVMVGNFIGDFVKGRNLSSQFSAGIARGIELHRAIDDFTDHHPVVKQSKMRLWPSYRHYSGVIIDIFHDHFLAAGWAMYSNEPLPLFASRVYNLLGEYDDLLPAGTRQLLPYMIRGNWLVNYATIDGIRRALGGMARRATFDSKMEQATEDLERNYADFKSEFEEFFPLLMKFSGMWLKEHPEIG